MTRTRGCLLACLMLVEIADHGRGALAVTQDQSSDHEHVRTTHATIASLIQHATERSETFRNLVQAINASDGIIYIEKGTCGHGVQSCLMSVTAAGPNRMLWVLLGVRGTDCDLIGSIGHELRHALEVLGNHRVTDFATMYSFFAQQADDASDSGAFETAEARRIGAAVRSEVRKRGGCVKVRIPSTAPAGLSFATPQTTVSVSIAPKPRKNAARSIDGELALVAQRA